MLDLAHLLEPILPLKVDLGGNAFLGEIKVLKIEFLDADSFDFLVVGYFDGVTDLFPLLVGRIERIVKVVIIEFDHIVIG